MPILGIVLDGDTQTGKTSLILNTIDRLNSTPEPTVGVAFAEKSVTISDEEVILNFWEIAGNQNNRPDLEELYSLCKANAIILTFTLEANPHTNPSWKRLTDDFLPPIHANYPHIPVIAVATKSELQNAEELAALNKQYQTLAKAIGIHHYWHTSAKTDQGINSLFEEVAKLCLDQPHQLSIPDVIVEQPPEPEPSVSPPTPKPNNPEGKKKFNIQEVFASLSLSLKAAGNFLVNSVSLLISKTAHWFKQKVDLSWWQGGSVKRSTFQAHSEQPPSENKETNATESYAGISSRINAAEPDSLKPEIDVESPETHSNDEALSTTSDIFYDFPDSASEYYSAKTELDDGYDSDRSLGFIV